VWGCSNPSARYTYRSANLSERHAKLDIDIDLRIILSKSLATLKCFSPAGSSDAGRLRALWRCTAYPFNRRAQNVGLYYIRIRWQTSLSPKHLTFEELFVIDHIMCEARTYRKHPPPHTQSLALQPSTMHSHELTIPSTHFISSHVASHIFNTDRTQSFPSRFIVPIVRQTLPCCCKRVQS
jgi:hypothetical protein